MWVFRYWSYGRFGCYRLFGCGWSLNLDSSNRFLFCEICLVCLIGAEDILGVVGLMCGGTEVIKFLDQDVLMGLLLFRIKLIHGFHDFYYNVKVIKGRIVGLPVSNIIIG